MNFITATKMISFDKKNKLFDSPVACLVVKSKVLYGKRRESSVLVVTPCFYCSVEPYCTSLLLWMDTVSHHSLLLEMAPKDTILQ